MTINEEPIKITDCAQAVAAAYPFIDGALAGPALHSMQSHLNACPPCAEAVQFQAGLQGLVRRSVHHCGDVEAPADLADRVFGRIFGDGPAFGAGKPFGS